MSRFRRHTEREVPGLNLASLPDLIFTVLFFFMIVTHMRQTELKVRYQEPQGTELEKTARKGSVVYLYIGQPTDASGNAVAGEPRIQIGNDIVSVADLPNKIAAERDKMSPSDRQHLTVNLHADRHVGMGLISDVKQALRRAGALRINYTATQQNSEQHTNF